MDQQLSFDPLLDLEQQFYQRGFDAGLPHGELHGLFEGRELGREKAWELCEEVGYYEGMAKLWKGILAVQGKDSGRCVRSQWRCFSLAVRMEALCGRGGFLPAVASLEVSDNGSRTAGANAGADSGRSGSGRTLLGLPLPFITTASQSLDQILSLVSQFPTTNDSSSLSSPSNADIDIPALLSSLRSKYRTACASLGVRPRLVAAESGGTSTGGVEQAGEAEGGRRGPHRPASKVFERNAQGGSLPDAYNLVSPALRHLPPICRTPSLPCILATPAIIVLTTISRAQDGRSRAQRSVRDVSSGAGGCGALRSRTFEPWWSSTEERQYEAGEGGGEHNSRWSGGEGVGEG
ncbi:hypothetical protein RTG_01052 [Rhodotorula toruloides ATCC 204091]|uniref:Essential protein Yae1 N-terminal domain-containing protein n=1 Tax=Rhodotorula toruloides TaxID=5286 RepID=A0A0K3CJ27_RHOTO|nr:hypothetical protein RTG_01052 [Rhodotorula toruloides ATCC 204091]PRQ75424.1 hypothetical protein AAT19DRAFT_14446 [Rhodotorula toruloides]